MPSSSKKQANFMQAVAHSPEFAKKAGVPQSVGRDFAAADKGRKFAKGGDMVTKNLFKGKESMKEELAEAKAIKSGKITPMQYAKGEKSEKVHKMNSGGSTESGGRGVTTVPGDKKIGSPPRYVTKILPSGSKPLTEQRPEKEGAGFKRGGSVSKFSRGGGVESRGKTKGKMITMMKGGKC